VLEHLTLAGSQRCHAELDLGLLPVRLPGGAVLLDGGVDGRQQGIDIDRLGEKITCALFHGPNAHGNVGSAGQKDNRKGNSAGRKHGLKVKTIQAGHRNIENHAAVRIDRLVIEKLARGYEGSRLQSGGAQQTRNRFEHRRVVVHDEYDRIRAHHLSPPCSSGSMM
jgi:hypothetical protein